MDKELAILRKKRTKLPTCKALVSNLAGWAAWSVVAANHSFNRAVDAKRQVGSLLKPFIYMLALRVANLTLPALLTTIIVLSLDNGETWTPKNYDGRDHGKLTTASPSRITKGSAYGHEFSECVSRATQTIGHSGRYSNLSVTIFGSQNLVRWPCLGYIKYWRAVVFAPRLLPFARWWTIKGKSCNVQGWYAAKCATWSQLFNQLRLATSGEIWHGKIG